MTTPNENTNGQGEIPALEPLIIPCQCGSDQANWIGDKCGLRAYLCPDCAARELNVNKGEESPAQFMLSALLVAETTLSAYGEHSPALAVVREAIARATIAGCRADSVALDWQNDLESFPCMD